MPRDEYGSELNVGDEVVITGRIQRITDDPMRLIVVVERQDGTKSGFLTVPAFDVVKKGESDTAKAARRGFNS